MKSTFSVLKYRSLARAGIMKTLHFRMSYIVTIISNLAYLMVIYYLWKAIYASSATESVNGMTFKDTFIYLVLATAIFNVYEVAMIWWTGDDIRNGKIVLDLIKPMIYQVYTFFNYSGNYIIMFFFTFAPTFLLVYFLSGGAIVVGINLILFLISLMLGLIINFCVDFFVTTICLYTQSTWGVSVMKEVIVLFVSGATVPLAFFPGGLKTFVEYLPFKSIYNTPLMFLVNESLNLKDYFELLLEQAFWVFVLVLISNAFWKCSIRKITVNGG
jgi:ABC-2 type transport system permease protein